MYQTEAIYLNKMYNVMLIITHNVNNIKYINLIKNTVFLFYKFSRRYKQSYISTFVTSFCTNNKSLDLLHNSCPS